MVPCPDCSREPCQEMRECAMDVIEERGHRTGCPPGADEDCTVPREPCRNFNPDEQGICLPTDADQCPEGAECDETTEPGENPCTVPTSDSGGGGDEDYEEFAPNPDKPVVEDAIIPWVSVEKYNALRTENAELKARVARLQNELESESANYTAYMAEDGNAIVDLKRDLATSQATVETLWRCLDALHYIDGKPLDTSITDICDSIRNRNPDALAAALGVTKEES